MDKKVRWGRGVGPRLAHFLPHLLRPVVNLKTLQQREGEAERAVGGQDTDLEHRDRSLGPGLTRTTKSIERFGDRTVKEGSTGRSLPLAKKNPRPCIPGGFDGGLKKTRKEAKRGCRGILGSIKGHLPSPAGSQQREVVASAERAFPSRGAEKQKTQKLEQERSEECWSEGTCQV